MQGIIGHDTAAWLPSLGNWLTQQLPGASDLTITQVSEPSQGFSSRTLLFTASWQQAGGARERALVARIQRDTTCPMLADVFHQHRVIEAVAATSDAAVPPLYLAERTGGVIGEPFFLMDRVEGRVPSDAPSYHAQGWLKETWNAAEREHAWWNAIAEMAKLHRIGWRPFLFLAPGQSAAPDAAFYLQHFIARWLEWAARGQRYPLLDAALRHLLAHAPPAEQTGLVWNDARMGNTMFATDGSVASLFDFEVATLGPAEIDLAWWLHAEDIFSSAKGLARLAGIPKRDEALRGFETLYGRAMPHFEDYEAIAALKHAVLSVRDYRNGKAPKQPEALPALATQKLQRYLAERGVGWEEP